MRIPCVLVLGVVVFVLSSSVFGEDLTQECGDEFGKVTPCLSYATAKATTPSKECCNSVKDIKDRDPKCLCFIIQQTHNGSQETKSIGIQESRLLTLSSACQIQNASISNCPRLLGLSPSSPDAAIFTKSSTAAPTTPAGTTTTAPVAASNNGIEAKQGHQLSSLLAIATAIFIFVFPPASTFMF